MSTDTFVPYATFSGCLAWTDLPRDISLQSTCKDRLNEKDNDLSYIPFVATRDCESFFLFFIFSCFALRKVSLISAFVIALGVVFC